MASSKNKNSLSILWLFSIIVLLHLVGAIFPEYYTWGFNYWGLFPLPLAIGILILAFILLTPPVVGLVGRFCERFITALSRFQDKSNLWLSGVVATIILFILFYIFRSRALVYGDGFMVLDNQTNLEKTFEFGVYYMKPLVVLFHREAYRILSSFLPYSPDVILGLINIFGGLVAFWALFRIAFLLASERFTRWFVILGTLTSGTVILFFGYLENYTWPVSISLWSLAFTVGYIKNKNAGWLALLTAVVAAGFHLFTLPFLFIAIFAVLLKQRIVKRSFDKMFWYVNWGLVAISFLVVLVFQITRQQEFFVRIWPVENHPYWFLSGYHLLDVFNESILVAPIGLLVLLYMIFMRPQIRESIPVEERLLGTITLMTFLFAFWIDPELGAPRDWDLLSFFGFPFTLWGLMRMRRLRPDMFNFQKLLFPVLILILINIIPNLYEKNHLSLAVDRLDKVLWDDPHYQANYREGQRCLSWGYTLRKNVGDDDRAVKYFYRRLQARKDSYQSWYNLGEIYTNREQTDSAYFCLNKAVSYIYTDAMMLAKLSNVELGMGKFQDALEHSRQAEKLEPDNASIQTQLAILYFRMNKKKEALKYFHRAFELIPKKTDHIVNLGLYFYNNGMYDSAYYYLKMAETQGKTPPRVAAYNALVITAMALNKYDEARRVLSILEKINPDSPDLEQLRMRIREMKPKSP